MIASCLNRRVLVAFCLAVFTAASIGAQAPAQEEPFVPQVGQAGKDVVWVPTPPELVEAMLNLAKVTPQDFVMDLGSGDGRNVIAAAKRGARAVGVEFNPKMVELSKKECHGCGRRRQGDVRRGRHVPGGHLESLGDGAVPAAEQYAAAPPEVSRPATGQPDRVEHVRDRRVESG